MRLIDADSLYNELTEKRDRIAEKAERAKSLGISDGYLRGKAHGIESAIEIMNEALPVSAEYVVHCKDCRYAYTTYCTCKFDDNGYCKKGER